MKIKTYIYISIYLYLYLFIYIYVYLYMKFFSQAWKDFFFAVYFPKNERIFSDVYSCLAIAFPKVNGGYHCLFEPAVK